MNREDLKGMLRCKSENIDYYHMRELIEKAEFILDNVNANIKHEEFCMSLYDNYFVLRSDKRYYSITQTAMERIEKERLAQITIEELKGEI